MTIRSDPLASPARGVGLHAEHTRDIMRPEQVGKEMRLVHKLVSCSAFALLMSIVVMAAPALADGTIVGLLSDEDNRILAEFDTRRAAAITETTAGTDPVAAATLEQVLAGQVLPFDDGYDPSGDWRCRFIRLGGDPVLTVHEWFSCRIFDDGAGWVIRKTGGTERTMGRLYRLSEDRLLYLGALHHADETPIWFGEDPALDQMAVLTRLDDDRLRLEFPAPLGESGFDILEFAR